MTEADIAAAIEEVREAQRAVTTLLTAGRFTDAQREVLDDLSDSLRDLDTGLVLATLKKSVEKLEHSAANIREHCDDGRKAMKGVKSCLKVIDQVADSIEKLVKVVKEVT